MRGADIQGLASATRTSPFDDPAALEALGIPLPSVERLETAVLKDLSVDPPYGISWWKDSIPTGHRIAISDQLFSCIQSISGNLIEAQLHWLEFLDWMERDNQLISVGYDSGETLLYLPNNHIALEFLIPKIKSMHEVGVIRSLCSSLDCLAGAIIGITALDMKILMANFLKVKNELQRLHGSRKDESILTKNLQAYFARRFHILIDSSGPQGWVDWMLHYRNMVVHRGRRINVRQTVPNSTGNPPDFSEGFRRVDRLPIDPNRSDIEVLSSQESLGNALLKEDSTTTIKGLLESTIGLIESTSNLLLHVWNERRKNPREAVQPKSQWGNTAARIGFLGYEPGEVENPRKGTPLLGNPALGKRLYAASIDDKSRHEWVQFKAESGCLIRD